ncbi:MAG: hypothetical protein ABWX84_05585 [Nocardioides sp.]
MAPDAYTGRWLVWSALGIWVVSLLLTGYYLAEPSLGFAGCELVPGSSRYGESSRSWLPPGQTCTYALPAALGQGQPLIEEPPTLRLLVAGMALTGLPLCLHLRRMLRRPGRRERAAA